MADDDNGGGAEAAAAAAAAPAAAAAAAADDAARSPEVVDAPAPAAAAAGDAADVPVAAPPSLPDWLGPSSMAYLTTEALASLRAGGETVSGKENQSFGGLEGKKTPTSSLSFP